MRPRSRENIVERLCAYLGRQVPGAGLLDRLALWIVPGPRFARAAATAGAPRGAGVKQLLENRISLMARGPGTIYAGYDHGVAPSKPHDTHTGRAPRYDIPWWSWLFSSRPHLATKQLRQDLQHAAAACSDPKYRGMHGTPCRFAGGTDTRCPAGATVGWFWSYDTPVGRYYYVDCCGLPNSGSVFCGWTTEPNWCVGYGRAAAAGLSDYTCTLAIADSDMEIRAFGAGNYEVVLP